MQMSEVIKGTKNCLKKRGKWNVRAMTLFTFQLYKADGLEGLNNLNKLRMRKGRKNAGQ